MSDNEIAPPLEAGESVIWTGRPDPLRYGWYKGKAPILHGALLCAMLLPLGNLLASLSVRPSTAALDDLFWWSRLMMGGMLIIIGAGALFYLLAPLRYALEARRTRYLLTDRRAVLVTDGQHARRQSFPLSALPFVEIRAGAAGDGDVLFAATGARWTNGPAKDGFIAIPDASRVESLLRHRPVRAS